MSSTQSFATAAKPQRQQSDPYTFKDNEARDLYAHMARSARYGNTDLQFAAEVASYVEGNMNHYASIGEALDHAYLGTLKANPLRLPPSARTLTNILSATWVFGDKVEAVFDPVTARTREMNALANNK